MTFQMLCIGALRYSMASSPGRLSEDPGSAASCSHHPDEEQADGEDTCADEPGMCLIDTIDLGIYVQQTCLAQCSCILNVHRQVLKAWSNEYRPSCTT